MIRDPLVFAATADISGKVKGKSFPASQLDKRTQSGVGWTPTNVQITCFDSIATSPFGALGDLALIPDPDTGVTVDFGDGSTPERFMLGDIRTLEGAAWGCCTRSILKMALDRLTAVSGLTVKGAFEHEFQLRDSTPEPGWAYSMAGFRAQAGFCEALMAALRMGGMTPDTIMKEYGVNQYEVTIGPETGVRIADTAVALRELTYATARRFGDRATFTPIRDPAGVGNGVHVHLSFLDADGRPATHDPSNPYGMSRQTGAFIAGILRHINSIVALTAPSGISYTRLMPHRWSAAYNNLGYRDREAAVRICPVSGTTLETIARGYNFEYRAADACASPHLALAALIHAGAQGIEDGLPAPEASAEDLSALTPAALAARGFARLPASLPEALAAFEQDVTVRNWFPDGFADVYLHHKRGELATIDGLSPEAVLAAYEGVY
jgi:glutamine synthetase